VTVGDVVGNMPSMIGQYDTDALQNVAPVEVNDRLLRDCQSHSESY